MNSDLLKSLILICFGLGVLWVALRRLRRYQLKERHALTMILLGSPFLLLAVWQDGVGTVAELLGIQYNTFSILCVTAFLFIMVFELLTIVSVQEQRINTLSQMVGLLMDRRRRHSNRLHSRDLTQAEKVEPAAAGVEHHD